MLNRLALSAFLAGFTLLGTTGVAFAQENPDREEVIIGAALVSLGIIVLVSVAYVFKLVFGLEKQQLTPPENHEASSSEH